MWMLLFAGYALVSLVLLLGGLLIPGLGFAGLFIANQLEAGFYQILLRRLRGFRVEAREVFAGFGSRYWQLTLAKLIQGAVQTGFALVLVVGLAPAGFVWWTVWTDQVFLKPELILALLLAGLVVSLIAIIGLFYFLVSWLFAAPLILDRQLDAWPALQQSRRVINRHPWRISWILLGVSTFGLAGILIAGIGVIYTGARAWAMLAVLYEDLTGDAETPLPAEGAASP